MTTPIDTFLHPFQSRKPPIAGALSRLPCRFIVHYDCADAHARFSAPVKKVCIRIYRKGQLNSRVGVYLLPFFFDESAANGIPGFSELTTISPGSQKSHGIGMVRQDLGIKKFNIGCGIKVNPLTSTNVYLFIGCNRCNGGIYLTNVKGDRIFPSQTKLDGNVPAMPLTRLIQRAIKQYFDILQSPKSKPGLY